MVASNLLLKKKTTWIIVADESAALVYERKAKRGPLTELVQLSNDVGRKRNAELVSDRGGRSFDSHGRGRHTMTREQTGPKERAARAFAKTVAKHVVSAMHSGKCDEFAVISPPRFLGVLRDALSTAGNVVPALTIDKEMVGEDIAAIEKLLARS